MSERNYEEGFDPASKEAKELEKEVSKEKEAKDSDSSEDFSEESLPSEYADALNKNKKESEEQLKELSGDYKVEYDKYLKEESNPKEEDGEKDELIRDHRVFDFGSNGEKSNQPVKQPEVGARQKENSDIPSEKKKEEQVSKEKEEVKKDKKIEPQQDAKKENSDIPSEKKKEEQVSKEKEEVKKDGTEQKDPKIENGKEIIPAKAEVDKNEENKESKVKEIELIVSELMNLMPKKKSLFTQKKEWDGLAYKLGIKKKDPKVSEEYALVFNEYNEKMKLLEVLTGESKDVLEKKYLSEKENNGNRENSSEDEKKAGKAKDFLTEKSQEIDKQKESLEAGKKGAFEKLKTLMRDKKFQLAVGLIIAGVAVAAPPTGFISLVTFGMHAGFLPVAYATKATALAGIVGGGFIVHGLSAFKEDLKKRGKEKVDLTSEIKKPDTNRILP